MLTKTPQIVRVSQIAFLVSCAILGLKLVAFGVTGSQVVFSDALEGMVHIVASGLTYFLIRYSTKPPDSKHPYGHGKGEFFSASFEGGLISSAGLATILLAVETLIFGPQLRELDLGILLVAGAGALNLLLARYLFSAGKKHRSAALTASAHHLLSDFVTSAGVSLA